MSVQVSAQLRQRFGHIFAAEAEADVAWLVVNVARKQQNASVTNNVFAEFERVALGLEVHEADGTSIGPYPFEQMRALLEESVEKTQIAHHDFQIALHEAFTMAQGEGGEKLARGAVADRGVVLEFQAALNDLWIAAGKPSKTQPRKAVSLAHGAQADGVFIRFASGGKSRGRVVLKLAVNFVGKNDDVATGG